MKNQTSLKKRQVYVKTQGGDYEKAKDSKGNLLFETGLFYASKRRGSSAWRRRQKRAGNENLIKGK